MILISIDMFVYTVYRVHIIIIRLMFVQARVGMRLYHSDTVSFPLYLLNARKFVGYI